MNIYWSKSNKPHQNEAFKYPFSMIMYGINRGKSTMKLNEADASGILRNISIGPIQHLYLLLYFNFALLFLKQGPHVV